MKKILILLGLLALIACSDSETSTSDPYQESLNKGWDEFKANKYAAALVQFREAKKINSLLADPYVGIAWSLVKLDSLASAVNNFTLANSFAGKVETFAGWGFTLNAQKNYSESNLKISDALKMDSVWVFKFESKYNHIDLKIVKAENYFALNQFSLALLAIKKVNPLFITADLNTYAGQTALAAEIERLKKEN